MGLTGLIGGGYPAHNYDVASPAGLHRHAYGARAVDSSGGIWQYVRASTASGPNGIVTIVGNQAVQVPTGNLSTTVGAAFGVQASTANSTTQDAWVQVAGPGTALGDTTAAGAGVALFLSTATAGCLSVTTTGTRVAVYIQSSGTSSLWNIMIAHNGFNVA